jgi:hypothetical protein
LGLAKYGRTEVIFGICNSVVLWFGAGHLLFSFLLLSSSKVFQSAFVPGLTSYYSRTSPSPARCVPYYPTVSLVLERQEKCSLSFWFDLTQSPHQLDVHHLAFVHFLFFGFTIWHLFWVDFSSSHKQVYKIHGLTNTSTLTKTFEQHNTQ